MKKTFAIILTLCLLLSCIYGCADTAPNEPAANKGDSAAAKNESKTTEYVLENETIADNEYCSFILANCQENSNHIDFKFILENKTSDKNLMFSIDDTALNGWIFPSLFAQTVAPGKKANETLSFSKSDLKTLNITGPDKLEFSLRIYDDEDWMADAFVEDIFVLYPTGRTEPDIVCPDRPHENAEMLITDNKDCSFIILETYEDDIWGYTVKAYLENKTDKTLMFSWDEVSVNGFMTDPFWACSLTPGNKRITEICFSSSDFEENGIDNVEEIEFELRIHDDNDFDAQDIIHDTFTYCPK